MHTTRLTEPDATGRYWYAIHYGSWSGDVTLVHAVKPPDGPTLRVRTFVLPGEVFRAASRHIVAGKQDDLVDAVWQVLCG